MRRKDRAMSKEFGLGVIDRARYGVVSVMDDEKSPYSIPLSIVRDGDFLLFHSAIEGTKVELFKPGTDVSVVFVGETHIPDNFSKEELDEMSKDISKGVQFISKVFTTEFESAVVKGKVNLVEDRDQKIHALKLICEKYTPDKMDYFSIAIKSGLDKTNIYSINIDEITAKRKKYDIDNQEMKWERME